MEPAETAPARGGDSLLRRIASATLGIPILFLFVWAGSYWFTVLVSLAALLGLLEFYRLTGLRNLWLQRLPGILLTALLVLNGQQQWVWAAPLVVGGLVAMLIASLSAPTSQVRPWLLIVAGPLYLGATLAYAVTLRGLDQGAGWVSLALLATFSVDTTAYFVGKAMGRHRMAPRISPGKTWEGALAGLMGAIVATPVLSAAFSLPLETWQAAALGSSIGVVAQAGDLLESALKRAAKAKEAGSLIPGHGGLLDRLDSIVFTLVVVYYSVTWGAT